jgi:pilus assembly protein Flp/PilA
MNKILDTIRSFAIEDEGAQVVEYALIIAVVSIVLVMALSGMTTGSYFNVFIGRLANCLNTNTCI